MWAAETDLEGGGRRGRGAAAAAAAVKDCGEWARRTEGETGVRRREGKDARTPSAHSRLIRSKKIEIRREYRGGERFARILKRKRTGKDSTR